MDIKELTIAQIEEIQRMFSSSPSMFPHLGKNVYIRTVTYHYTGRAVRLEGNFLVLEHAAWVASSRRWTHALKTGELDEVEPYPNGTTVNIDTIVDVSPWDHVLPKDVK